MRLICIMRMGNTLAHEKVAALVKCESVNHLTLIRHEALAIESDKLTQKIHDVGLGSQLHQPLIARLRNMWATFWQGWRETRQQKPDFLIAVNLVPYGVITWLIGRITRRPVILSLVGADVNRDIDLPLVKYLFRHILRTCAGLTIFGEEARQKVIAYGVNPERAFVLPHTANTEIFYPNPDIQPEYDLIFVGFLRTAKRADLVLQALQKVHESRPETTLLIVGDGPERQNLEHQAEKLGIAKKVIFHGFTNNVVDLLWKSRIFVLLSPFEGLPYSMIEAMCAGVPVVVAEAGSIATVVKDGENGVMVPSPADPAVVAERILQLLQNPDLYQRIKTAAAEVKNTHSYEAGAKVWDRILTQLKSL